MTTLGSRAMKVKPVCHLYNKTAARATTIISFVNLPLVDSHLEYCVL